MYQPYYYQPYQIQQDQPQAPQQAQNGMIWVNSYNDALQYPVCPNSAVNLWDSTAPCVYVKSADATGKPSMKIYDLVERKQQTAPVKQNVDYITRDEFEILVAKVDQLNTTKKKKEVAYEPTKASER